MRIEYAKHRVYLIKLFPLFYLRRNLLRDYQRDKRYRWSLTLFIQSLCAS